MADVLTRNTIESLIARARVADSQEELIDAREPGLRIRAGKRTATWQLSVRLKTGERTRIKLGQWPEMGLSDARTAARKKRASILEGENPNQVLRAKVREAVIEKRKRVSLFEVLNRYEEEVLHYHRSGAATRRALDGKKGLLTPFAKRALGDIGRAEVSDEIRKLAKASPTSANRKLAYASAFFNWCVEEELIPANPAATIRKPAKESVRDRFHTLDELTEIWSAMLQLGWPFSQLFRLMMVVPMRREELAAIPVADLTLGPDEPGDAGVWLLPGGRTKNGHALRVPISWLARQIIVEALNHPDRPQDSKFLFSTNGKTSVSGYSKAKRRTDTLIEEARIKVAAREDREYGPSDAMPHWVLHDLRTSFNTHACEILNVPPHVADRILNHVATATRSKIMRVYNKSELFDARRAALADWADLLKERVISAENG